MLSPEQMELRKHRIGASEVPALFGLHPQKHILDLWMRLMDMLPPEPETPVQHRGNLLEDTIARWYAGEMGVTIERAESVLHPTLPWLIATPDRLVRESATGPISLGLEVKTRAWAKAGDWGPELTDEVPHAVALQCHAGMMTLGFDRWDVAVALSLDDWRVYRLHRDPEIEASIMEAGRWFYQNCLLTKEPPELDGSPSAHRLLALRFPTHDADLVETTPEIDAVLGEMRMGQMELKAAEERISRAQVAIKQVCGDHAGLATRRAKVTWLKNAKGTPGWKDIALEAGAGAELIAKHTPEGSRVLRVKWSGEASD